MMELKDRIYNNLKGLQLTEEDKLKLSEELLKDSLVARVLSDMLATSDAQGLLMVGLDLLTDEGIANARQQQLMARGLAEAVELIVDQTVVEKETNDGPGE